MATESQVTAVQPVQDVGLRRDVGLIGGLWASEGSIIGSGWLFGALGAIQLAGTAGILAWVITGGVFTDKGRAFLDATRNPCVEKPVDLDELRALVASRIRMADEWESA